MNKQFGFSRKERLTKDREFQRVFQGKKSFADKNLIIYILVGDPAKAVTRNIISEKKNTQLPPVRLGLVVSRKLGKAVKRNKVKRRLREIFRLHKHQIKPGYDIIFLPQEKAVNSTYQELEKSVLNLFARAGLLIKN